MRIAIHQLNTTEHSTPLKIERWEIEDGHSWGVFSSEGDIGSQLGALLCGDTPFDGVQDAVERSEGRVAQVSLASQQQLLEEEIANDDTDFLDRIDSGTSVETLVKQQCDDLEYANQLMSQLDLCHLANSGFRQLSTGETRRVMLARALASKPDLLVLDNPFSGLDVAHRESLSTTLAEMAQQVQMIVTFNREEDLPPWIDQVALFHHGQLESTMASAAWHAHPVIAQLQSQSEQQSEHMLALVRKHQHSNDLPSPVFAIKDGEVAYTDKTIFTQLNWQIDKGQHWQIKGPNGCGKSTLLGLIFGDHPQCYSNDITIFGHQRGSGETIWQIKQNIGMVSSSLHLQYRVSCSVLDVILSGFYDSIGLYQQPSKRELQTAHAWLAMLHMTDFAKRSFRELDYGQQRLVLIARALVKQPALLILDEPYQGLDYLGRRLVKNSLEMIARENLSQLLYVSHYEADKLEAIRNELSFEFDESMVCYVPRVVIGESSGA